MSLFAFKQKIEMLEHLTVHSSTAQGSFSGVTVDLMRKESTGTCIGNDEVSLLNLGEMARTTSLEGHFFKIANIFSW